MTMSSHQPEDSSITYWWVVGAEYGAWERLLKPGQSPHASSRPVAAGCFE